MIRFPDPLPSDEVRGQMRPIYSQGPVEHYLNYFLGEVLGDFLWVLSLEEPYRVDQILLSTFRDANPLELLYGNRLLLHQDGVLTRENLRAFLKRNHLPTRKDLIDPNPPYGSTPSLFITQPSYEEIVGRKVRRGLNWNWGTQDHFLGRPSVGTILGHNDNQWVDVRWASQEENDYRWGAEENFTSAPKYDLLLLEDEDA